MRAGLGWLLVGVIAGGCHVDDDDLEAPSADDAPAEAAPDPEPAPEDDAEAAPGESFTSKVVAHTEAARAAKAERDAAEAPQFEIDESLSEEERAVEAKALFVKGVQAFEVGRYEEAAVDFEHAYAYTPDLHVLAYNAARAHEHAGHCRRARELYERFVDLASEDAQVEATRTRLDELRCDDD